MPMLGPCAQRQRYATACCAYRPTFIRCLWLREKLFFCDQDVEEIELK